MPPCLPACLPPSLLPPPPTVATFLLWQVPVGLNYFSGHRFRSRVFIDIGDPLEVPPELVAQYAAGGVFDVTFGLHLRDSFGIGPAGASGRLIDAYRGLFPVQDGA